METATLERAFPEPGFEEKEAVGLLIAALKQRLSGRMTQEELTYHCALWTLDNAWGELHPKPSPTQPEGYTAFISLTKEQKEALTDYDLKKLNEKFGPYWESLRKVKAENQANCNWLQECYENLRNKGSDLAERFRMKLIDFQMAGYTPQPIPKPKRRDP